MTIVVYDVDSIRQTGGKDEDGGAAEEDGGAAEERERKSGGADAEEEKERENGVEGEIKEVRTSSGSANGTSVGIQEGHLPEALRLETLKTKGHQLEARNQAT